MRIVVIDYGSGNLRSIVRMLDSLGHNGVVSTDPAEVERAEKILLPGVGHFGRVMGSLRASGLGSAIEQRVLGDGIPILGICLGLQLMTRRSEEGDIAGWGWFDAEVRRFAVQDTLKYKVPHIGWNDVHVVKKNALLPMDETIEKFYFVHAYHVVSNAAEEVIARTDYEYDFVSALCRGNIFGVQFHPEKSRDAGRRLLKNFCEL